MAVAGSISHDESRRVHIGASVSAREGALTLSGRF
jgi:hypothetical protein